MSKRLPPPRQLFAQAGQALALEPSAFGADYEMSEHGESDEQGPIAVICIDGPLSFKSSFWFDSYESIQCRFAEAMQDSSVKCVVLNINSPGGEAAGNAEAVRAMRAMKTKPVIAVANEAAYSAAYAIACVADEVYLPEAAGVGSIGVIAGICDVTEANKQAGVRVELVTSGTRKADGNPNNPITDDALSSLQDRVDQLAGIFFDLVKESRGIDAAALQAGCFYGSDAVSKGLADGVMSFDEVLALAGNEYGADMKLIERKQAAPAANKGASMARAEKEKEEKDDEKKMEEEKDDSSGDVSDKDKEKDDSSGDVSDKDDDKDDEKEEEEEEESDEADDAKSMTHMDVLSAVKEITGHKSFAGMIGALHAFASSQRKVKSLEAKVARLSKSNRSEVVASLVDQGVATGKLTPSQRDWATGLGMKSKESLDAFLATAPARVVKLSHNGEIEPRTPNSPKNGTSELTDEDKRFAKITGISEEKLRATKAKLLEAGVKLH